MAKKPTPNKGAAKKSAASSKKPLSGGKPLKKVAPASPKTVAPTKSKAPTPSLAKPQPKAKSISKSSPNRAIKPDSKTQEPALLTAIPQLAEASPPPLLVKEDSFPAPKVTPPGSPLTVSIQSSQGLAANGNTHPANLLVIVTCSGWPVTELSKDHFTLMEHFEVPGQTAPFSNNITSFRNAGTGAYLLQIRPINGAPWRSGHHLGQLLISTAEDQQGQAAFKLIIR